MRGYNSKFELLSFIFLWVFRLILLLAPIVLVGVLDKSPEWFGLWIVLLFMFLLDFLFG